VNLKKVLHFTLQRSKQESKKQGERDNQGIYNNMVCNAKGKNKLLED
jgi:hypothetical protein